MAEKNMSHHDGGEGSLEWHLGEGAILAFNRDGAGAQEHINQALALDMQKTVQLLGTSAAFFMNIAENLAEAARVKATWPVVRKDYEQMLNSPPRAYLLLPPVPELLVNDHAPNVNT